MPILISHNRICWVFVRSWDFYGKIWDCLRNVVDPLRFLYAPHLWRNQVKSLVPWIVVFHPELVFFACLDIHHVLDCDIIWGKVLRFKHLWMIITTRLHH